MVPQDKVVHTPRKSELELRKYPVEGISGLFDNLQIFASFKNRYDGFKPPTPYHGFYAASVMSYRHQLLFIHREPIERSFQHRKQRRMWWLSMLCWISKWLELLSNRMGSFAGLLAGCLSRELHNCVLIAHYLWNGHRNHCNLLSRVRRASLVSKISSNSSTD